MSQCFCSLKNFSQSRTQSPSRLWVARRAGRPGPCGASPADSRSPRCWQTPGLRAKETPKRQRRKLALAWLTFFLRDMQAVRKVPFRLWAAAEEDSDGDCGGFRSKKNQKKQLMWRFENGGRRRLEPDKSYKSHMKCNRHYEGGKQRKKIFMWGWWIVAMVGHNGGFCTSVVWIEEVAKEAKKNKQKQTNIELMVMEPAWKKWNKNLPSSYVIHAYRK